MIEIVLFAVENQTLFNHVFFSVLTNKRIVYLTGEYIYISYST